MAWSFGLLTVVSTGAVQRGARAISTGRPSLASCGSITLRSPTTTMQALGLRDRSRAAASSAGRRSRGRSRQGGVVIVGPAAARSLARIAPSTWRVGLEAVGQPADIAVGHAVELGRHRRPSCRAGRPSCRRGSARSNRRCGRTGPARRRSAGAGPAARGRAAHAVAPALVLAQVQVEPRQEAVAEHFVGEVERFQARACGRSPAAPARRQITDCGELGRSITTSRVRGAGIAAARSLTGAAPRGACQSPNACFELRQQLGHGHVADHGDRARGRAAASCRARRASASGVSAVDRRGVAQAVAGLAVGMRLAVTAAAAARARRGRAGWRAPARCWRAAGP